MATAPIVTETEAGAVVVIPPAENAPSTSEAEWQQKLAQIFTMQEEMRSQMSEMRTLYQNQAEMLTNLVNNQQETITRLSGQVSEGTATVVAALATLTPQPPPPVTVVTQTPLTEGSQTVSPASEQQGEVNPVTVTPNAAPRKRRFL